MCAGALAQELLRQCPTAQLSGMGGNMLAEAGATIKIPMSRLCFTGFWDVLRNIPNVMRLKKEIVAHWKKDRPDSIILVDCPDFNLPLAKEAHALNIPVYYFMAPQFWAWKQHGMKHLQNYVDSIICALPFEPDYFQEQGCKAHYVGHPLQDIIPLTSLDALSPDHQSIGLLPGSRKKEIQFLLPEFIKAAQRIHQVNPSITFSIARAPGIRKNFICRYLPENLPVTIVEPESRFEMIRKSYLVIAASGTATLETALIGTPTIVAYKLDSPAAFILQRLAIAKFMSLTNILFNKEIFPELLQKNATAESYSNQIMTWLNNPELLKDLRSQLQAIRHLAGPSGGLNAAAKHILVS